MLLAAFLVPSPALPMVCEPKKTGNLFRPSGMLVGDVAASCSVETMVTGVGELAVSEITREPVTTTLSTPVPDCASAAEPHSAETAAPHARMFLHFMVFPFPVEFFCSMSENALFASGYKNRRAALTGQCRPSTARSMTVG